MQIFDTCPCTVKNTVAFGIEVSIILFPILLLGKSNAKELVFEIRTTEFIGFHKFS